MSEQQSEQPEEATGAAGTTGHPAVDEVLRSLQDLEERPVDEHVEVFENAHEQLRRALNDAGTPSDD